MAICLLQTIAFIAACEGLCKTSKIAAICPHLLYVHNLSEALRFVAVGLTVYQFAFPANMH